ncbi:MAG: methyltransferase family protein [Hyphomicrobiales bacterium]
MEKQKDDTPGVIAPPPLIYLGFLVLSLALDYFWPVRFLPESWRIPLAVLLIVAGAALVTLGLGEFRRVGTEVSPLRPSTALATGGIYRYTRNPLYVSLAAIYLGIAAATNGLWILLLAIPLLVVIRYGVIAREERYLEAKFGEAYRQYKGRVRRWM